jgi:hypothetical protein
MGSKTAHFPIMADERIRRQIAFLAAQWFEDLQLLNQLDRRGRMRGAVICEPEEALEYIRELDQQDEHE